MITKIAGLLTQLGEDVAVLHIAPFHYEVLVPDFTRRQLQMKIDQEVELHTIQYIDGNVQKGGRMTPRMIGFNSIVEREFFEMFCSVDGVGVNQAGSRCGSRDRRTGRHDTEDLAGDRCRDR